MMMRHVAFLCSCTTLALVGCSETNRPVFQQTFPVRGKVLSAGGAVLAGGRIELHPENSENPEARGMIDSSGKFVLGTYKIDDGVVPGNYTVTIDPLVYDKSGNFRRDKSLAIPKKYADAATSPLKLEVKAEPNDVTLKLN